MIDKTFGTIMKGYTVIKREFECNRELETQATVLFNLFLQSPRTEFSIEGIPENFNLLKERGELKDWNSGTLKLQGGDAFFCLWFEHLKEKFPVELCNDYKPVTEFIDKVEDFYREQKIRAGLNSLVHRLEQWLIVTLNHDFDCDFYSYAQSLKKNGNGRDIYEFADRFGNALPFLNISIERLIPTLLHLSNELRDERSLNYPDGSIRVGLKDLVFANPPYGEQLLTALKSVDSSHEYQGLVLSGLIECGGMIYLTQIKDEYLKGGQQIFANALSILRKSNDELAGLVLEVIHNFNLSDPTVTKYVPSIYYTIIQRNNGADELKAKAFTALTSIWTISKEVKPIILSQLQYIEGFESERRAFLIEAFKDEDVNVSWLSNMHGLHEITTPDFIFDLISVIANRVGLQFDVKILEYALSELVRKDDGNFSNSLIRLLIHDNGFVRFAGSRIYTHLTFGRGEFRFSYDILSLKEAEQIKLIIAVLTEMNPPQDTLANILKFLDSPYEKVVNFLIRKLEIMVESFFDSVSKEMQVAIEHQVFKNTQAIEIVKAYHDQFVKYIDEKENLKELNPWLNEYNLVKYYSETVQLRNSRMVSEAMNKNSFLSHVATNVNLTKGGGWKLEGRDSVQQLGHFSSSAPFPRVYFIAPEYLDRVMANKYLVNWEQIFKWEQIQL